jgi:transposase
LIAAAGQWVVKRTLPWLHRFGRLAARYERREDVRCALITLVTWSCLKRDF